MIIKDYIKKNHKIFFSFLKFFNSVRLLLIYKLKAFFDSSYPYQLTYKDYPDIPNWSLAPSRVKYFLSFLKKSCSNKSNIKVLEVGGYIGVTTILIGNTLYDLGYKNFEILTVDPFLLKLNSKNKTLNKNFAKKVEKTFKRNIKKQKWKKNHKLYKSTSIRFYKKFCLKSNLKFDFIFIDGSHAYKDVFNDIQLYTKQLRKNSYLVVDDFEHDLKNLIKNTKLSKKKIISKIKKFKNSQKCIKINNKTFHPGVTLAIYELEKKFNIRAINNLAYIKN